MAGNVGVVRDISLFFTTIVTAENRTVTLQNSAVTGAAMINFSTEGTLRAFLDVSVQGTRDVASTTALLLKAARGAEHVQAEPPPEVVFNGLADGSLQLTISVWGAAHDFAPMVEAVQRAVLAELSTAGGDLTAVKIAQRTA